MIDLDQLSDEFSEGGDIILQTPQPHIDIDSNKDVEDESEDNLRSGDEGDMPLAPPPPLQIEPSASPLADPTLNDNISPPELKVEPRSPPQFSNEETDFYVNVPNVPVNLPKTRVYVRKPLPPPRQKEGTRKAFDIALKTLSSTLKRKK